MLEKNITCSCFYLCDMSTQEACTSGFEEDYDDQGYSHQDLQVPIDFISNENIRNGFYWLTHVGIDKILGKLSIVYRGDIEGVELGSSNISREGRILSKPFERDFSNFL